MKAQTKRTFGNIFGGLISNQRAIDGAKESPWWIAIIFLILSIFIPVIPTMVATSKADGASFMAGYTYDQDAAFMDTSLQYLKEKTEFKFYNSELRMYINDEMQTLDKDEPYVYKIHTKNFIKNPATGQRYTNEEGKIEDEHGNPIARSLAELIFIYVDDGAGVATDIYSQYLDKYFEVDADFDLKNAIKSEDKKDDVNYYTPSILVAYRTGIAYSIKKIGKTDNAGNSAAPSASSWNHTYFENGMLHRILKEEGKEKYLSDAFLNSYESFDKSFPSTENEYLTNTYSRLANVFTESYLNTKSRQMTITTFMYIGIYLVMIVFMGLLIFILTRGKQNVFRYLKFWTCMKIAMWASFAPAILALVLGFLISSMAVMAFIILEGMRIMWLCMRQLRPQ